jgi:hypothetical protein
MPDRWIIRVAGKEYGPVDLEVLREWKREGRLLSANEARLESESQWSNAGAIPGLFQSMPLAPSQSQAKEIEQPRGKLFRRTFQIYGRGFFQFLALSGLVIVPSLCGQLVSVFAERLHSSGPNFLGFFSALLAFFMMVILIVLWPVYLAGLQIVAGELAAGRRIGLAAALNRAAKFWPRVAILCLIVYGVFFLLLVFIDGRRRRRSAVFGFSDCYLARASGLAVRPLVHQRPLLAASGGSQQCHRLRGLAPKQRNRPQRSGIALV